MARNAEDSVRMLNEAAGEGESAVRSGRPPL
jgi:hypothetical protein